MIIETKSKLINDEVLCALEQVWGFKLPTSYRNFILQYNGGKPIKKLFDFKNGEDGSKIQNFLGITPVKNLNLLIEFRDYEKRIPNNMLPIAYDSFGNLILISVKNNDRGKIYFWDHEMEADPNQNETPDYSNLTLIADSFEEFVNGLYSEEDVDVNT